MSQLYNDSCYQSFEETTLLDLLDKEGFALELDTNDNTVKLATGPDNAIGVLHSRNTMESKEVTVRLFGCGGTYKAKAGGVIAKGARVKVANGGKFVASTAGDRSVGLKRTQGNAADNDLIEVIDSVEFDPQA